MPFLTVVGALVFALAGAATLAFRVVKAPTPRRVQKGAQSRAVAPQLSATHPAAILLRLMTDEYQRHTRELRVALSLRRKRAEAQAQTRLLNERLRHALAARDLGHYLAPKGFLYIPQRMLTLGDLNAFVERVRQEARATRVTSFSAPLRREGALRRFVIFVTGGDRDGFASQLVAYHRAQRDYYREAVRDARLLAESGRAKEALTELENEQMFHMRIANELGELLGIRTPSETRALTAPRLTTLSQALNPPEPVTR